MTTTTTDQSYVGVGKVWARLYGSTNPMRHVGNVSKLDIQQKLKTISQKDYTRAGGGTRMKLERLDSVDLAMTWLEFMTENFTLAVGGTSSSQASATVASEPVTFTKSSLVRLANPVASVTSVKKDTTTYVEGVDYEVSSGGIFILATGTIATGDVGEVTYEHAAYDEIESATQLSTELELFFEGLNEAESNLPVLVDVWRVHVSPADTISLLSGDNPGDLQFAAEALKDENRPAGKSQFFRTQRVRPA